MTSVTVGRRAVAVRRRGTKEGVTSQERDEIREEIRKLKVEVKKLHEANEILKAASDFFAGELDPRRRWSAGS